MGITVEILRTNIVAGECIVKISDDSIEITTGNIGLELNPDQTPNTAWITHRAKEVVAKHRQDLLLESKVININIERQE